jgi:tetratricopeptide (TPR) repeat protein
MKKRCLAVLLSPVFLLLSCAPPRSPSVQSQHAAVVRSSNGRALLLGLIELDQGHPGSLALKADLGAVCLSLGDTEQARIYLEAGRRLARKSRDARLVAMLHADLAELAWRTGDPREAVRCCETAISLAPDDPAGARLTRAKALAALGEPTRALEDFSTAWDAQRAGMLPEDCAAFARLLAVTGSERKALDVLADLQARFPHEQGVALEQSALFGRLGMYEESILAAYEELEYQLYAGGTSTGRILEGLSDLDARLTGEAPAAGRRARRVAAGLARHARGDWSGAAAELSGVAAVVALPIGRYVLLSARLEAGQATTDDLASYLSLEGRFRDLAGYYYHLWRGTKASGPGSRSGARSPSLEILEKCIQLAPHTEAAAESRRELGRVLGLEPPDGAKLLLPVEIEAIAQSVAGGGDPSLLEPLLGLLSTPANRYQAGTEPVLQALARRPDVGAWLAARRAAAGGRLKERLAFLLGG